MAKLMLVLLGWMIAFSGELVAAEGIGAQREPIVLQPSDAEAPPVVLLEGQGTGEEGGPLVIGPFELIDQDGRPFSSEQLAGHHWVASFIFTSCMGYCPNLIKELRFEVVDRVENPDVRFVTISVDPDRDTPQRLKQFAEVFGADPARWVFLTGDRATIEHLVQNRFQRAMSRMDGPDVPPGFEVAHSLDLIHVGPDGCVLGTYDSREVHEVLALRRVLRGEIETPEENRPSSGVVVAEAKAATEDPTWREADRGDLPFADIARLPDWAARLPRTNAMLNGLASVLLLMGLAAIKGGNVRLHKRMMLTA
ncbi:MAG: SCO family protein, partial [Planctomycetaceae bacterium]